MRAAALPSHRALLDRGFRDLTVLDISAAGMRHSRDRLGSRADQVHWVTADVLSWDPQRHYQAWHDRAVYHFLTTDEHRQQYLHTLDTATAPGAVAVFGCFAPDGPPHCSGLPEARYSPAQLARQIGPKWLLIGQDREEHITRPAPSSRSPGSRCDDNPESWFATLPRKAGLAAAVPSPCPTASPGRPWRRCPGR